MVRRLTNNPPTIVSVLFLRHDRLIVSLVSYVILINGNAPRYCYSCL